MSKLAALDLGSNSFHLLEAISHDGVLHFGKRLKEKVQIGAGLDADKNLSQMAIVRSLACISSFDAYMQEQNIENFIAVGTNTLRVANNADDFLRAAEEILGQSISIIDGADEARIIYRGVHHELRKNTPGLIIDIGGGSTEFAVGKEQNIFFADSLEMGCVSYYQRFFADGKIYPENINAAEKAAFLELEKIREQILDIKRNWTAGTSGTLQSINQICRRLFDENDMFDKQTADVLNLEHLSKLNKMVLDAGHISSLNYEHLDSNRRAILPAGLAITSAIFKAFDLESMDICHSALCEGLLLELNQELASQ